MEEAAMAQAPELSGEELSNASKALLERTVDAEIERRTRNNKKSAIRLYDPLIYERIDVLYQAGYSTRGAESEIVKYFRSLREGVELVTIAGVKVLFYGGKRSYVKATGIPSSIREFLNK